MASALFKSFSTPPVLQEEQQPHDEADKRNAFGELESIKAPVVRGGSVPVRAFQSQEKNLGRLFPQAPAAGRANKAVAVFEDENGQTGVGSVVINPKIAIPIQSAMKTENQLKAGKWAEAAAVVNETGSAHPPPTPSFQIHVDDNVQLSSQMKTPHGTAALATKTDHIGPLRDVKTAEKPAKLFERENPSVRLMCDLNRLLVGQREFSFEEIRRQIYVKAGRGVASPMEVVSKTPLPTERPVSPAVLLNVSRSREKSKRPPTERSRTPCGPFVPPPPPLKPNEKWGCTIHQVYNDGREFSFEQLRAAAQHVPSAPLVVSPARLSFASPQLAMPDERPTFDLPAIHVTSPSPASAVSNWSSSRPPMKDMAVQTDLFGLEYDVVLVPRKKEESPVQEEAAADRLTPEFERPTSPTVNTKLALSSVKSW